MYGQPISRIKRPIVLGGVLAALALGAVPASPAAAGGEVHFDPDSPAGKEYALPLPQARNEALGGEGITGGSPAQAPLFGVGVSGRSDQGAGAGVGGEKEEGRAGGRDGDEDGAQPANGDGGSSGASGVSRQADDDSSYSLGTGIGLVAAVLVAGLLLGILLRVFTHTGRRELNTQ